MKVVLFGLGEYYKNRREKIDNIESLEIVAYSDNNAELWEQHIASVKIVVPDELPKLQFDKVIITSTYVVEIREQLLNLGIQDTDIIFWEDYWSELISGTLQMYYSDHYQRRKNKNVLIISTDLNYNGGSLAAVYAGMALRKKGYCVTLAVPDGNMKLIQETVQSAITVAVCPAIPYIKDNEIQWMDQFDIILINILRMMPCVSALSGMKPLVWWIHESVGRYSLLDSEFGSDVGKDKLSRVQVCTVSRIPKNLFDSYIENGTDAILHYGIPDKKKEQRQAGSTNKIVFAVIGGVCVTKGQDIFIEAIRKMREEKKENIEFWLIGDDNIDESSKSIVEQASMEPAVKVLGEKTRQEMELLYSEIDVVVSTSRFDSLPIIMTEAMMYGKICIASDVIGTVDYIEDGKNGFIVQHESSDDLYQKMEWIIDHLDRLDELKKNARKTYEKYFTMEKFGTQLEKMFNIAKRKQWGKSHMES